MTDAQIQVAVQELEKIALNLSNESRKIAEQRLQVIRLEHPDLLLIALCGLLSAQQSDPNVRQFAAIVLQ